MDTSEQERIRISFYKTIPLRMCKLTNMISTLLIKQSYVGVSEMNIKRSMSAGGEFESEQECTCIWNEWPLINVCTKFAFQLPVDDACELRGLLLQVPSSWHDTKWGRPYPEASSLKAPRQFHVPFRMFSVRIGFLCRTLIAFCPGARLVWRATVVIKWFNCPQ